MIPPKKSLEKNIFLLTKYITYDILWTQDKVNQTQGGVNMNVKQPWTQPELKQMGINTMKVKLQILDQMEALGSINTTDAQIYRTRLQSAITKAEGK